KEQAPTEQLEEIVLAAENQCAFAGVDRQCHADAAADIFLKASRTGEALARMDDLRKSLSARIEPGPVLAATDRVFRHRHHACGVDGGGAGASSRSVARQRQR